MTMTAIAHFGKLDPGGGSSPFCRDPVDVAVGDREGDVRDAESDASDADADAIEILARILRGGDV
jgi:hypothetical protein